jgi:hypothetical protein
MVTVPGLIYKYNDQVHFLDCGTDTLYTYSVTNGKLPYAICELGAMKCPANIFVLKKQETEALSSKRIENCMEKCGRFQGKHTVLGSYSSKEQIRR